MNPAANPSPTSPRLEAKHLYRRLDALFRSIEKARTPRRLVEAFLDGVFRELAEPLKFRSASLYMERPSGFRLSKKMGELQEGAFDTLSPDGEPLSLVLQHRVFLYADAATAVAAAPFGHARAYAACVVGRRPRRYVYVFALGEGFQGEEIDFTLNTLRASLSSRLMEERLQGGLREAAEIQASLLPDIAPAFPPFEMAQRSHPAEEVGGDFFDYRDVRAEEVLGIAIGDASGHGLPAALLVRDVVIGLRMGLEKDLRIASVFKRLNRVIHESTLSSKFISVFYAELEKDGTLTYVNAGHPSPLLISSLSVERLSIGGTVIGPLPEVRFKRGLATLAPNACLVACTDGILERRSATDEFYGENRLIDAVRRNLGRTAPEILAAVFKECETFGGSRPFEDDATLVIVKHATPPV
jgi:sigma-B regulation protein RsbU (phosphoserine phosphatase)